MNFDIKYGACRIKLPAMCLFL